MTTASHLAGSFSARDSGSQGVMCASVGGSEIDPVGEVPRPEPPGSARFRRDPRKLLAPGRCRLCCHGGRLPLLALKMLRLI